MSTIPIAEPIQERFDALREDWKSRTRHLSNVAQIALVSSYQHIIGMGPQALPLVLAELQQHTDLGSGHSKRLPDIIQYRNQTLAIWQHPLQHGSPGENRTAT